MVIYGEPWVESELVAQGSVFVTIIIVNLSFRWNRDCLLSVCSSRLLLRLLWLHRWIFLARFLSRSSFRLHLHNFCWLHSRGRHTRLNIAQFISVGICHAREWIFLFIYILFNFSRTWGFFPSIRDFFEDFRYRDVFIWRYNTFDLFLPFAWQPRWIRTLTIPLSFSRMGCPHALRLLPKQMLLQFCHLGF